MFGEEKARASMIPGNRLGKTDTFEYVLTVELQDGLGTSIEVRFVMSRKRPIASQCRIASENL